MFSKIEEKKKAMNLSTLQTLRTLRTLPPPPLALVPCDKLKFLPKSQLPSALAYWLNALELGRVEPDEKCWNEFVNLSTTPDLYDPRHQLKKILNQHFYPFRPADVDDEKRLSTDDEKHLSTGKTGKVPAEFYVSSDILSHLPPALAAMVLNYHPQLFNCDG